VLARAEARPGINLRDFSDGRELAVSVDETAPRRPAPLLDVPSPATPPPASLDALAADATGGLRRPSRAPAPT
jgi:hypothetical protein